MLASDMHEWNIRRKGYHTAPKQAAQFLHQSAAPNNVHEKRGLNLGDTWLSWPRSCLGSVRGGSIDGKGIHPWQGKRKESCSRAS